MSTASLLQSPLVKPQPPEQRLGSAAGGVWTRRDALEVLSSEQVRGRLRCGEWRALRPGIYTNGWDDVTALKRAWAAVLAGGGVGRAVATGRTAARVHGLPLVDDHDALMGRYDEVHDDVWVGRQLAPAGALHVTRGVLPPRHSGRLAGCPTASPLRTLADLATVLRPDALVCALDSALHRHLVTVDDLMADAKERRGARGSPGLRQAVAVADARAESPLESLGRLLTRSVVPGLVPQLEVRDAAGAFLGRLDFGDAALRLGVEGDGRQGHAGDHRAADDRWRDSRFREAGWTVERYTWWEVRKRPDQLQSRLAARVAALSSGGSAA